jgi:hypothetical protein
MQEIVLWSVPVLAGVLKVAAAAAGLLLGVRLLAAGGRTADDRDRLLLDAARRHGARR